MNEIKMLESQQVIGNKHENCNLLKNFNVNREKHKNEATNVLNDIKQKSNERIEFLTKKITSNSFQKEKKNNNEINSNSLEINSTEYQIAEKANDCVKKYKKDLIVSDSPSLTSTCNLNKDKLNEIDSAELSTTILNNKKEKPKNDDQSATTITSPLPNLPGEPIVLILKNIDKPSVKCKLNDAFERITLSNQNHSLLKELPEINNELLGSVTAFAPMGGPDTGLTVRTSARVIQKMRMDSIRVPTPPPAEKKDIIKDERPTPKTPNQSKAPNQPKARFIWTNVEKNLFFEGLNEFGKDFDALSHYINTKMKRKTSTDPTYKTKDNIRHLYYQTFSKVSKFLKFSDDVKKVAQELYALINYGEMRKKLLFFNEKTCMKLKDLVYKGSVIIRFKGKNIKIKTPSCKALRQLNQLEEWQEEIQLPQRINVYLKPSNIEAWGKVQSLAQNPRIKTVVPLHKRVVSLLKTLQYKWRDQDVRLIENAMTLQSQTSRNKNTLQNDSGFNEAATQLSNEIIDKNIICFAPPPDTKIYRPMVNLTEFLSSYSICLNSYEQRIGAKTRGEILCSDRINNIKDLLKNEKLIKRQRNDSGSGDKKSPDSKRNKIEDGIKLLDDATINNTETKPVNSLVDNDLKPLSINGGGEITEKEFLINEQNISNFENIYLSPKASNASSSSSSSTSSTTNTSTLNIHELKKTDKCINLTNILLNNNFNNDTNNIASNFNDQENNISNNNNNNIIKKKEVNKCNNNIRRDTKRKDSNAFRPLISEETIRKIREGWTLNNVGDLTFGDLYVMFGHDLLLNLEYHWEKNVQLPTEQQSLKETEINMTNNDTGILDQTDIKTEIKSDCDNDSNENIDEHEDNNIKLYKEKLNNSNIINPLGSRLKQLLLIANMAEKLKKKSNCNCGHVCNDKTVKKKNDEPAVKPPTDNEVFKQPSVPPRNPTLSQFEISRLLNKFKYKQSKYMKMRNRYSSASLYPSKQVIVQRLLPLQPGVTSTYGLISTSPLNPLNDYQLDNDYDEDANNKEHDEDQQHHKQNPARSLDIIDMDSRSTNSTDLILNKHDNIVNKSVKQDLYKIVNTAAENNNNNSYKKTNNKNASSTAGASTSTTAMKIIDKGGDSTSSSSIINSHNNNNNNNNNSFKSSVNKTKSNNNDNSKLEEKNYENTYNDNPIIDNIMELSLSSMDCNVKSSNNDIVDGFTLDSSDMPPMSPLRLLREIAPDNGASNDNSKWLDANMQEFSLSSFLGHLDSISSEQSSTKRKRSSSQDTDNNISIASDTSIDYMRKFAEITAEMLDDAT